MDFRVWAYGYFLAAVGLHANSVRIKLQNCLLIVFASTIAELLIHYIGMILYESSVESELSTGIINLIFIVLWPSNVVAKDKWTMR